MRSAARTSSNNRNRPSGRKHPTRRRGGGTLREARPRARGADEDISAYLPLVRQVVQQIQGALPASIEHDEVMSWGVDGLLDAFKKFDPGKATHFQTYARIRIRGAILDQLRSLDWVSRTVRQKANHLVRSSQQLEHQLGRQASHDELACAMGLKIGELHDLMTEVGDLAMVSLEDVAFGRNNERLGFEEFIAASTGDPMAALLAREQATAVAAAIEQLPEKERMVMPLYYHGELTMKEVGARLGITESRVSQLHTQAISRLRSMLSEYAGEVLAH
ncbi:MAG TPA: FliA/WhiG family RNA polymerase sigma factor [Candidatus Binatia bacterium]|nr:FliA/WhiG family RNA polymerase sigma factor [Candidatus Binatia bacterium]